MSEQPESQSIARKGTDKTVEKGKTARINFEAPKSLKIKFKAACASNDTDMTEEFIKFMREYVK